MDKIDERTQAALIKFKQLQERNNDTFLPLFWDMNRHLVLCGGGGSGKSIFAGQKVLERITSEQGHRILVCRKVARTLRESCFRQLIGQIREYYNHSDFTINKTDMTITYKNGSEIVFSGLDDVEKLKSIYHITSIWIEEASEIDEGDYNQLNIRLRDETKYYKQIITTFNPISATHWLKQRFFDKDADNVTTHRSTYKDNRFLSVDEGQTLEDFKDTDPYYYSVYCLGEWGVYGKTVFDAEAVTNRLQTITAPIMQGYFDYEYNGLSIRNIKFINDKNGYIKIYKDRFEGCPYVTGGDTAGDGSDSFTAQVLDNIDGSLVATFKQQFDEDEYARQVYCLATYYNDALVSIETNFSTHPVRELERLGYKNQYFREIMDSASHRPRKQYGFNTNGSNRNVIIANLIGFARDNIDLINDRQTLEEMLTFVRNDKGRPEAQQGAHDDLIMALAIAHNARPQQKDYIDAIPVDFTNTDFNFRKQEDAYGIGDRINVI